MTAQAHQKRYHLRPFLVPITAILLLGCDDDPTGPDPSDHAPVISVPSSVSGTAGGDPFVIELTVSDPDGDAIATLTADWSSLPDGSKPLFTKSHDLTSAKFTWTPAIADTGTYAVIFAASNALRANRVTTSVIVLAGVDSPPLITMPASVQGFTGYDARWPFAIHDPNGDIITFGYGAAVDGSASSGNGTSHIEGELNWQACKPGSYMGFLWARSGTPAQTDTAWTEIVVSDETVDHYIDILDGPEHFSPDTLVIQSGETVAFRSADGRRHQIFQPESFGDAYIKAGCQSRTMTYHSYVEPPTPRTFVFYCNTFGLHPRSENGVIIVNPVEPVTARLQHIPQRGPKPGGR